MNIAAEYAAEDQYTKVHQRNNNVNYVKNISPILKYMNDNTVKTGIAGLIFWASYATVTKNVLYI